MYGMEVLIFVAACFSASLIGDVSSSAIPIWEKLTQQEKIGQLMYTYLHLVDLYCKESPIPDCAKVLTLYGTSTLVNQDEHTLNTLDPHQRNARNIIWDKITNGAFNFPPQEITNNHINHQEPNQLIDLSDYDLSFPDYSDMAVSEPHPYSVRVAPPADFQVPEYVELPPREKNMNNLSPQMNRNSAFSTLSLGKVSPRSRMRFPPGVNYRPYTQSNSFRGQIDNLGKPVRHLDFNGLNLTSEFSSHPFRAVRRSSRIGSTRFDARTEPFLLRILNR